MIKQKFDVGGMSCEHCVAAVGDAVRALPGVATVEVSLEDAAMDVAYDEALVSVQAIIDAVVAEDYEATLVG